MDSHFVKNLLDLSVKWIGVLVVVYVAWKWFWRHRMDESTFAVDVQRALDADADAKHLRCQVRLLEAPAIKARGISFSKDVDRKLLIKVAAEGRSVVVDAAWWGSLSQTDAVKRAVMGFHVANAAGRLPSGGSGSASNVKVAKGGKLKNDFHSPVGFEVLEE